MDGLGEDFDPRNPPYRFKVSLGKMVPIISKLRLMLIFFGVLFSPPLVNAQVENHGSLPTVTLWLIPIEPAVGHSPLIKDQTPDVSKDILNFQRLFGPKNSVTVLNATPPIDENLLTWNQEFFTTNWEILAGQIRTLKILQQFAKQKDVHINVLFVDWSKAFSELRLIAKSQIHQKSSEKIPLPDVAQVGSTWITYFKEKDRLLPIPRRGQEKLKCTSLLGVTCDALKFTVDVRLLYYWKRLSSNSENKGPFHLDTTSWQTIHHSLKTIMENAGEQQIPPMVFPVGYSTNLIHDYAPLIWAGNGHFLTPRGSKVFGQPVIDLTSNEALKIPLFLTSEAATVDEKGKRLRLFAFPEMTHEEAASHFYKEKFFATIEPLGFLKRWFDFFVQQRRMKNPSSENIQLKKIWERFRERAGISVSPIPYRGGSEIILLKRTLESELSAELAHFLVASPEFTNLLAENGKLPAQRQDLGIASYFTTMTHSTESASEWFKTFEKTVYRSIDQGEKYPDFGLWPTDVEALPVLDEFQRLWRRMGEGDVMGVKSVAKMTEELVNRRINFVCLFGGAVMDWWPLVSMAGFVTVGIVLMYQFRLNRERKGKRLGFRLYQSQVHTRLSQYGSRVYELATKWKSQTGEELQDYGKFLAKEYNVHLRDSVKSICEDLRKKILVWICGQFCRILLKEPRKSFGQSGWRNLQV